MKKTIRCCLAFVIFMTVLCSAEEKKTTLNVGMELSYPPFETVNEKGEPKGISVDLSYALGNWLHESVIIQNIPYIGLIPALKAGKIDLIISSMTKTAEREKAIDFSDPYLAIGLCLLLSSNTPVNTIEELDKHGYKILVKLGTTGEVYAKEHIKYAEVIALEQESSCVTEIVQGKANAFIYDQLSVYANSQKYPKETKANLMPFKKEYWAIGIRKDNNALKAQVNQFLKDFRNTGGFQKLADTYLSEQQAAFKKLGVPFVFSLEGS